MIIHHQNKRSIWESAIQIHTKTINVYQMNPVLSRTDITNCVCEVRITKIIVRIQPNLELFGFHDVWRWFNASFRWKRFDRCSIEFYCVIWDVTRLIELVLMSNSGWQRVHSSSNDWKCPNLLVTRHFNVFQRWKHKDNESMRSHLGQTLIEIHSQERNARLFTIYFLPA